MSLLQSVLMRYGPTRDIIIHQYVTKQKSASKSWVTHIKRLLHKYLLPKIGDLPNNVPYKVSLKERSQESYSAKCRKMH